MVRICFLLLAAVLASPFEADHLAAQAAPLSIPDSADTPSTRRLHEIISLINEGGREEIVDWARENVAPGRTAEWLAGRIAALQGRSHGYDLVEYQILHPDATGALLRNRRTGMLELVGAHVEAAPPHRVTMLPKGSARPDPTTTPVRQLSDAEIARELRAYFAPLAEDGFLSGVVLVAKDGEPFFHEAYGLADRNFQVPNGPETRFGIGSMNKMFTAVAILQLVEIGALALDDPLSKYLPDFPTPEAAQRIRIEHLLTHTSGLGDYLNRLSDAIAPLRSLDDHLALVRGQEPFFEPGTQYRYSNTGFLVLGKVIEIVSGQDYLSYVQEHIYEPAGMHNTDAPDMGRVNADLAVGYSRDYLENGYYNNLYHGGFRGGVRGGPAGGGYSTAQDLLSFGDALRAGTLVSPEMFRLMTTPKPEFGAVRYGYGFLIEDDGSVVGHNGGWLGLYSKLDIYLDNGYTAVVLTNLNPGEPETTFEQKIRQLIRAGSSGGADIQIYR